jgi:hypothetical protein
MIITEILAVLSASAAAGMRITLPLLVVALLQSDKLWSKVPLLSYLNPQVVLSVLISWSLFELFGSKQFLGQRILQLIELLLSPLVGALMAITVAKWLELDAIQPIWILGIVGGVLALVLKLVRVGWFFRLKKGIPIGILIIEDILCIFLVLFAFKSPQEGGLIAMLLLWLALRSSSQWRNWYAKKSIPPSPLE